MARKKITTKTDTKKAPASYLERVEKEVQSNQSKVSLVLGALIVLVIGILVFNYFNRNKASLGPAQQTSQETEKQQDVSPDNLPGKYTVKEGDTLFTIAEKYYQDGSSFTKIALVNDLTDVNQITTGQVLEIPKLETELAEAETEPSASPESSDSPKLVASTIGQTEQTEDKAEEETLGTGTGGGNSTIWGDRITGNSYTVVEGDWLSTIAGRAYGDIMAYDKIAKANNIANPDIIEPGQVLTIPR